MKTFISIIVFIVVVLGIGYVVSLKPAEPLIKTDDTIVDVPLAQNLCYRDELTGAQGLKDVIWLTANIDGTKVSGEVRNLPAEKDSKIGSYSGMISAADANGVRVIDAIWQTQAEGMNTPEQLIIKVSTTDAQVGFGEMVDRGDGTYVYKTPEAIPYYKSVPAVSCDELVERTTVEKYVRANIATISKEKTYVGGTWYVTTLSLDAAKNTGALKYEDRHVQKSATFSYMVDAAGAVTIENFKTSK